MEEEVTTVTLFDNKQQNYIERIDTHGAYSEVHCVIEWTEHTQIFDL